jgi:uncharacterized membrane protein YtjA (UPF0391 family)
MVPFFLKSSLGNCDNSEKIVPIKSKEKQMLYWAVVFLIIAIIAALFGFTGIAVAAASIAKILFFIFIVIFIIFLILGIGAGRRGPPVV